MGVPVISSWSLAKATMLPANEIDPMTMLKTLGNASAKAGCRPKLSSSATATSAAAPPPTPLEGDHLRDGGHLHHAGADASDRRADDHPDRDDDHAGRREVEQRQRGEERDHHAHGSDEVPVARALWRAELLQPEDEADGSVEGRDLTERGHLDGVDSFVGVDGLWALRPLNISSIRSVTTKPPTTLVVARVTATSPRTMVTGELAPAAMTIAPTRMMP